MSQHNIPQNASNEPITRRQFLTQAAALPAALALPNLPEVGTQEAAPANIEAHRKQLLDFTVELADFQAYLLGITQFGKPVDRVELFQRWSKAIRATDDLNRFLLEDFDDSLQALCGGYEPYRQALDEWQKITA
jgi:hypothetical protein